MVFCFTSGEGLDNFWRVLLEGKNCVVEIPAGRFDTTCWYDADGSKAGKTQTTKAALIEGLVISKKNLKVSVNSAMIFDGSGFLFCFFLGSMSLITSSLASQKQRQI